MTSQLSLLLIEDDAEFLEILTRRFLRRGFDVDGATSMVAAMDAADRGSFDVVLMDRTLKGLDCLDWLPRLKQAKPGIKVIVLSGRSDSASVAQTLAAGADGYLTKPCSLAEIEQAIIRANSAINPDGEVNPLAARDRNAASLAPTS